MSSICALAGLSTGTPSVKVPPGHHRVDSATKSERVERLHQPPLRIRTLSEIQISDPVEQHDDPGVLEFAGRLVKA